MNAINIFPFTKWIIGFAIIAGISGCSSQVDNTPTPPLTKADILVEAGTWNTTGYDDSAWSTGPAGFGTAGTPGIPVNTTWNTADIWLRQTFNPGSLTPTQLTNLQFNVFHDEGCEIYLNGVLAASATNYTTGYVHLPLSLAGRNALILNTTNVLAVHCHQTTGGQGIDVGLDITTLAVSAPSSFTPNWTENGPGLTAQYFSDPQLTTPAFTETDPNLSYFWAYNSPGPGLPGNNFSVRWSGWIVMPPRKPSASFWTRAVTAAGRSASWKW